MFPNEMNVLATGTKLQGEISRSFATVRRRVYNRAPVLFTVQWINRTQREKLKFYTTNYTHKELTNQLFKYPEIIIKRKPNNISSTN